MFDKLLLQNLLKPFKMIAGLITPVSIGFTNTKDIQRLCKRSRFSLFIVKVTCNILCPTALFLSSTSTMAINYNLSDFLFFGIPWIFIYIIDSHLICCNLCYQVCYFYIMCEYLSIKLRNIG